MNVREFLAGQFTRVSGHIDAMRQARELAPVQAKAIRISLEGFAAGTCRNYDVRGGLSISSGPEVGPDRKPVYAIALKSGNWLSGCFIAAVNISDKIVVGPVVEGYTSERLVGEQIFEITEVDAATEALLRIAERELAYKQLLSPRQEV